ncbi:hypothetical protein SAMN04488691_103436 [Haloferax larsenii]|uniref:DUF8123 domain-containing protein n=2 Tax=Haloferax larsenii TaxID=302484 RepID=A0A1H7NVY1_HALLR|nr:hypothetical protein SAMN04488691_103436 [Haloferax larsenii]
MFFGVADATTIPHFAVSFFSVEGEYSGIMTRLASQWKQRGLWIVVGVFVALVGLGTLVGMPWRYAGGGAATAAIQILAALATVGIGAAVAWLGVTSGSEKR